MNFRNFLQLNRLTFVTGLKLDDDKTFHYDYFTVSNDFKANLSLNVLQFVRIYLDALIARSYVGENVLTSISNQN